MNRIEIVYDGHPYSTAEVALESLKARILDASRDGKAFWLTVNEGAGSVKAAELLINSSTRISLTEIVSE